MKEIKVLLDTNIMIGILKAQPPTIALLANEQLEFDNCAISQITRMELLSYPSLEVSEKEVIQSLLANLLVLILDERVEEEAIAFRCAYGVKLPDAIIAATAKVYGLRLLTFDQQLHTKFTTYITDG